MFKVLHIAPHLSTGGMPEFLYQILLSSKDFVDNYVLEYEKISSKYYVQRNKIHKLIGEKLLDAGLKESIKNINPDIIYIHEAPEYWMSKEDIHEVYHESRNYKIIESSHTNDYTMNNKEKIPEHFNLITSYQEEKYKKFNRPITRIETDIILKENLNKRIAQLELNFNPGRKHVLNNSIFTPNKNLDEFFDYAEKMQEYPIDFHIVGVMAANFEFYWGPLLEKYNHLKNVFKHGQIDEVDLYYEASDLFLFTSNAEAKPLCVMEAISYQMPILMKDLENYYGYYNKFENISFLSENIESNIKQILQKLNLNK